jgi:RNA polymerase Rpb1, domain 5
VKGVEHCAVQTEGVNFEAIWALPEDLVLCNDIKCNDIYRLLCTYGVEAARQSIVSEVLGVFGVYGIDVNPRHLSLIADFMTRTGSYLPMNRQGMTECSSPFLQMSFETTCNFLTKAAQEGASDAQESPSSRIVLGSVPKVGTGCFDIMVPLVNARVNANAFDNDERVKGDHYSAIGIGSSNTAIVSAVNAVTQVASPNAEAEASAKKKKRSHN